jgi:hypothetical protein
LFERYDSIWYLGSRGEEEKMRRIPAPSKARSVQWSVTEVLWDIEARALTSCLGSTSVDGGARNQDIVNDGEDTLAAHPMAILVLDSAVVQHGSLVKTDATAMDFASKGDFIWMEIFPARPSSDFMWQVAKYVLNGVGTISDMSIKGQIWSSLLA